MRPRMALCVLLCLYISDLPAWPQQVASSVSKAPVRDSQSVALLQQSVAAMGGLAPATQVQSVVASGTVTSIEGSGFPSGSFTWKDQFTVSGHEFASTFQSNSGTQQFVSGHGNPGFVSQSAVHKLNAYVASTRFPVHLPALVLSGFLADANVAISAPTSMTFNGTAVLQVKIHNDSEFIKSIASVQTWYLDPVTRVPLAVDYRVLDNNLPEKYAVFTASFSDFRSIQGLAVPFKIAITEDGVPETVVALGSVSLNTGMSSSEFDLPAGAQ